MLSHNNTFNMCGASVTPAVVLGITLKSGLHWEMHMAQQFAMELLAFSSAPTVLESEITDESALELLTLMGMPVVIDNERYPKSLVRLMLGDKELGRLECLGIPNGFVDEDDYTEEGMQREREKFQKLTY